MSKEDSIEVTGTVMEKFPSGLFSVQLDQERTVLAHLAGKTAAKSHPGFSPETALPLRCPLTI